MQENKKWLVYKAEHECVVMGKIEASVGLGTGVTGNGSVATTTVVIPGKTGYRCNDGMEYWR